VSPASRWAPACAGIVGAAALMCAGPALVLGRDRDDTDVAAASVAATQAISKTLGTPSLSRGEKADNSDKAISGDKTGDRHDRRPFSQPPGHQGTPARDAAPGHVRPHEPPPVAEDPPSPPSGDVLGATPGTVKERRIPASGGSPQISESASRGVLAGIGSDVQPELPAAITNGPRSAVALGGVLGVTAAFNPAYGELATPKTQNGLAAALLLIVLGAQAIAGALLLSAARDMLGGVGSPRLG
jgi:hypothetical protein